MDRTDEADCGHVSLQLSVDRDGAWAINSTSVTLVWYLESSHSDQAKLSLSYAVAGTNHWTNVKTLSGNQSRCVVGGLHPFTTYNFTLKVAMGDVPVYQGYVSAKTTSAKPSPPRIIDVKQIDRKVSCDEGALSCKSLIFLQIPGKSLLDCTA